MTRIPSYSLDYYNKNVIRMIMDKYAMDQMEAAGIVGPASGGKPRKALISPIDVDQLFAAP